MPVEQLDIDTPNGPARAHLHAPDRARALVVLGHGAGGGVQAPDLVAVSEQLADSNVAVARVEQPYRVAGRRAPAPARQLDANWIAIVAALRERVGPDLPLVVGGRSMGARVACRTAADVDASGVVCLAFPLQPRPRKGVPVPDRLHELDAVAVPTLVVQGERDAFGMPPDAPTRTVTRVSGDHSLKADVPAVADAVGAWLDRLLA